MRKLLQAIMDRRPVKVYQVDGKDLFYRAYLFRILGWTWYLHHYLQSDPDRGLHSHPFSAIAIVLAGGYWEYRLVGLDENGLTTKLRRLNPGAINRIDQNCFHKLELNGKTSWSLFICKYINGKSWGFIRNSDEMAGHKTEGISNFHFRRAGIAVEEKDWWKTAPKGRENCRIR